MHLFKFWACRTQLSAVAGRELVRKWQGKTTSPKGILQILGIYGSGCLFQKGTALLHSSFQRVRGHFSLFGGWLGTDMCTLFSPCLPTSPFSPAIPNICLLLETCNTKAQNRHSSICGMTSTHLLLHCSVEASTRSSSWRRWGTKVGVEQTVQQLKRLEKVVPALVDLSLASLCSEPSFPRHHLSTDQRRSRHQRDACLCAWAQS